MSTHPPSSPSCQFGGCDKPAEFAAEVRYPARPDREAFVWPEQLCREDLTVEQGLALLTGATITATPIAAAVAA